MRCGAWIVVGALAASTICLTSYGGADQRVGKDRPQAAGADIAFARIASVLQSPRCINCHPRDDRPTQGDDRRIHGMNVQRGADGNGMPAMRCSTCHQEHNNDVAGVPGARHWHLAPATMGWVGLSKAALCRTLLDRKKNGGRSVADLITHITGDKLVGWAWDPGARRSPPPVAMADLKTALDAWALAGAPCPK
jgi:hypothetical protein